MDYESCYERIWRAGLLKKASDKGINGRMWICIKNFLLDRQYYIKVNDYKSPTYKSAVGIPQGSVISPVLCNLYTGDAMEGVKGLHAEFADDATVVNSDSTVSGACEKANNDMKVEGKWCRSWNMSVLDKTEVIIPAFFFRKKGYINFVPNSVRRPSVCPSVRPSVTFLVNASPPKPSDIATLNFVTR